MDRIENIDFCIRYLMQQEDVKTEAPSTLKDKQQLLRALMNVWVPQQLSEEFLRAQDSELQAQLKDKGIVDNENQNEKQNESQNRVSQLSTLNSKLSTEIWQGDITRLKVDAIVNAANSQGLGCWQPLHACIDNAIHSASGLQLRQECNNILRGGVINTGEAIITPGYNLPARYVIHTVGPIVSNHHPTAEQREQLANCYRSCIELALRNGCRSIAFCCISTGVFGYPNREAAEFAIETVIQTIKQSGNHTVKIVFNVFKDIDYDIYRELLGTH